MTTQRAIPLRILLVDDDEHDQLTFRQAFHTSGIPCNILNCTSSAAALEILGFEPLPCDVVVIHHHLPGICGLELCRMLIGRDVKIPLVILTDHGSEDVAADALQAGAYEYVIKDRDNNYLAIVPALISKVVHKYAERLLRKQIEEDLRESRKRLAQIVEGFAVATFVIDARHTITHWNRACANITGVSAEEMIGTRHHWRAFYSTERPVMADLIVDGISEEFLIRNYARECRRSTIIEGAYEAEDYFPHFGSGGKWLFFTAAPIRDRDGKIIGAIETLQDITERKQAEQALRESEHRYYELSITDALTGLYNSRHFHSQLQIEMERAERYRHPLSLLLLDVDDFKRFNDAYGHLEGDRVLAGLAQVIRESIRHTDSAYRYGGEEFVAILPETDGEEALRVAERLRLAFAKTVFIPVAEKQVSMTVSIGISCLRPEDDAKGFIHRADNCTYSAKRQGKNRVVYEELPNTATS
ncbi:diguanylate cyclase [Geobacter sp. SVR]|uniref:diguanylate cyclase n=1 Tax=Geobacter sp. SVR TaxID=2495594 RepID=UPI00143F01B2|nr:diguanylate cyclase [Geobacter sp. SVR]BCS52485.1 hypothetical protein GSVR_07930 [Geobacter sp. SVR]GCF84078.1 hypothetical protein GSbR_06780 [Geobacter sp. SVR]